MKKKINMIKDNSNNNPIERVGAICFYVALLIEILIVIIDKSSLINPFEGRLFQITFVLCMMKIIFTKFNLREWLLMVSFFIVGFISYQVTHRNEIIRFVAFVAASKGLDNRKMLRVVFYSTFAGMIIIILLALTKQMGTIFLEVDYYRGVGVERRYCLGMGHPNALHCMFWALLSLGVYIYHKKLKWYHYLVFLGANIFLFMLTGSRTGLFVSMIVIVLGGASTILPLENYRILYLGTSGCIVASTVFSVIVASINGPEQMARYPIINWINIKLTGRLLDSGVTGDIHKWSLFSDNGNKGYMDMGYIKLFHWYGIAPAIMYLVILVIMVVRSYKRRNVAAVIMILSFSLYTIAEAHAISPYIGRNYMMMLLFGTWSEYFSIMEGDEGYFWQLKRYMKKTKK